MQRGLLRTLLLSAAVPCVVPLGAHGATPSRLVRAVPPRARAAPLAGARKQTWLYVANYGDNDVAIYRADGLNFTLISELKTGISGPAGISLDPAGTLYVANYNNASVTVYPAGETSPSLTLTQGITQALDAAIDSAGNVWVANRGS